MLGHLFCSWAFCHVFSRFVTNMKTFSVAMLLVPTHHVFWLCLIELLCFCIYIHPILTSFCCLLLPVICLVLLVKQFCMSWVISFWFASNIWFYVPLVPLAPCIIEIQVAGWFCGWLQLVFTWLLLSYFFGLVDSAKSFLLCFIFWRLEYSLLNQALVFFHILSGCFFFQYFNAYSIFPLSLIL